MINRNEISKVNTKNAGDTQNVLTKKENLENDIKLMQNKKDLAANKVKHEYKRLRKYLS